MGMKKINQLVLYRIDSRRRSLGLCLQLQFPTQSPQVLLHHRIILSFNIYLIDHLYLISFFWQIPPYAAMI